MGLSGGPSRPPMIPLTSDEKKELESVSETFILMYYLERACKNQLDIYSTGLELSKPSSNLLEYAVGQYEDPMFRTGKNEWPALIRLLDKKNSIYKQ